MASLKVGAKPPSSPTAVDRPRFLQHGFLSAWKTLHARAQGLGEASEALGHDHELLEIDGRVRVRAAVDDVHHRHGEHLGVGPTEVFEKRRADGGGGGVGVGEGNAEEGVRAELLFVLGAIEFDEGLIERDLIERIHAAQGGGDVIVDRIDGLGHALAEVAFLVAVTEFPSFVLAGGGPTGHGGTAMHAAFEVDFDFDGGVAAGIEDFQGADVGDGREIGHGKNGERGR